MKKVAVILRSKRAELSERRAELRNRKLMMPADLMIAVDLIRLEDEIEIIEDAIEDAI